MAEQLEIPRTTLQHWQRRKEALDVDAQVAAFFESPAGAAFLHRLVVAAHFVMTQVGPCGIRLVCLFLQLSLLDRFVAASYGPHQKVSAAMEQAIVAFGRKEGKHLSAGMSPKKITTCQDETFHPEPCLVAIEPVSNFILLEKYAKSRRTEEWTAAMQAALAGMPVEVIQSTSDEGRGLLHHVREDLGVHHSPDLLHIQSDLVKATSASLACKARQAQKAVEKKQEKLHHQEAEKATYLQGPRPPGRPPGFDQRILKAKQDLDQARQTLERAQDHQQRAKEAMAAISETYHPYDLTTGKPKDAQEVAASLEKHFAQVEEVARKASLSDRCLEKIHKARRMTLEMVSTIAFFFLMIRAKVEALCLPPYVEQAVYEQLIPGIYLSIVAEKADQAQQRHLLQHRSQEILAPLLCRDGPFGALPEEDRLLIEQVAKECACLFQRSSSCVEGRNGQLALRHHSLHRISNRKLEALTTVHNYFVERPDGTTPAERFFGVKPRDLFLRVLEHVQIPGRPAQKRAQQEPKVYLLQALA